MATRWLEEAIFVVTAFYGLDQFAGPRRGGNGQARDVASFDSRFASFVGSRAAILSG
jgi:hypothetical protein